MRRRLWNPRRVLLKAPKVDKITKEHIYSQLMSKCKCTPNDIANMNYFQQAVILDIDETLMPQNIDFSNMNEYNAWMAEKGLSNG